MSKTKKMKKVKLKQPEIMAPVRNFAGLEACRLWADAVYFGCSNFSMRVTASALKLSELESFVARCHKYGIKAYLTVNSTIYNKEIEKAEKIIKKAKEVGVDAVIVWDPAVLELARKYKLKFFISTQANISNYESALFYKKQGASRVVLARELSLEQIKEIKEKTKMEIETFVHGAMCLAISGRCILSAYLFGKSANRGACSQPCRKRWILTDRDGNKIVNEGKYFMNSKDICMIEYIPELMKAGIDSFKIEGRRRDAKYIETTSRCYKQAVEAVMKGEFTKKRVGEWKKELEKVYNRGFSTGFYFGEPSKESISYDKADNLSSVKKHKIGRVTRYYPKLKVASIRLEDKGLAIGESVMFEGVKTFLEQKVTSMQMNGEKIEKGKKGQIIAIKVSKRVRVNDYVFIFK